MSQSITTILGILFAWIIEAQPGVNSVFDGFRNHGTRLLYTARAFKASNDFQF